MAADPWGYKSTRSATRNCGTALRIVDKRAELLDASNLMEEAALDRYEFIRDGFLQRRQSQVFDGEALAQGSQQAAPRTTPLDAKGIRDAYADDRAPRRRA